jgi:type II secretion system protein H
VFRRRQGFSLVELVTVVAIIGIIALVAIPAFGSMRRKAAIRAASAELRTIFHLARSRAIARGRNCGLKFAQEQGEWKFALYDDGDRDGVRNDDISKGIDKLVRAPRPVFQSRIVTIGLLGIPMRDPDGDKLRVDSSPVAFNKSAICSFSPVGEATPGTIYITDQGRDLWAVRVLGATARVRMLRYDRLASRWSQQ